MPHRISICASSNVDTSSTVECEELSQLTPTSESTRRHLHDVYTHSTWPETNCRLLHTIKAPIIQRKPIDFRIIQLQASYRISFRPSIFIAQLASCLQYLNGWEWNFKDATPSIRC